MLFGPRYVVILRRGSATPHPKSSSLALTGRRNFSSRPGRPIEGKAGEVEVCPVSDGGKVIMLTQRTISLEQNGNVLILLLRQTVRQRKYRENTKYPKTHQ